MPIYALTNDIAFPPPEAASPDGLLAVGGDLRRERLLLAYSKGIFPWFNEGDPILWWSPDPRLVIVPGEIHVSRSLKRAIKARTFRVSFDEAFTEVVQECAAPRGPGRDQTWITRDMQAAYAGLHEAGYAHSVEVWREEQLVGGLYGVSIGGAFSGESMFSAESDASKIALVTLARTLESWKFDFIDCQMPTKHLMSMGARKIPRREFLRMLDESTKRPSRRGRWRLDLTQLNPAGE